MNFFSDSLGMCVPATVILPKRTPEQVEAGYEHKVLYLLHGASGDHNDWVRETGIERYAMAMGLCVVMPSAHLSRYCDMAHGGKFFSFIADELPKIMRGFFPISNTREDNYICGLSMGGAGALRLGLMRPEQYCAIGCLSAGLSNYSKKRVQLDPSLLHGYKLVFGDVPPEHEWPEMRDVALQLASSGSKCPRIYHTCGTEDFLLDNARQTRDLLSSIAGDPYGYIYEEYPGAHTWDYWDAHIKDFLRFMEAGN